MPSEGGVEFSPDLVLDDETIKNMKVAELRIALQACGVSKNELNASIVDQLKTVMVEGVAIIQDRPVVETKNGVCNVLHDSTYWKGLEKSNPNMENSIMDVYGVSV